VGVVQEKKLVKARPTFQYSIDIHGSILPLVGGEGVCKMMSKAGWNKTDHGFTLYTFIHNALPACSGSINFPPHKIYVKRLRFI